MFKVGDIVKCIAQDSYYLTNDRIYIVRYVNNINQMIGFDFDDEASWDINRFKLNIKEERKQKLEKLYESK